MTTSGYVPSLRPENPFLYDPFRRPFHPSVLPFRSSLVREQNYFFVSLEIDSKKVDLSATFTCRVRAIRLKEGAGETPLTLKEEGPAVRRLGIALRTRGDDGADSYRIPCLVRTTKGTLRSARKPSASSMKEVRPSWYSRPYVFVI